MQDRSDEEKSLRTPSPLRSRTAKSPDFSTSIRPDSGSWAVVSRRTRKGNTVSCSSARGISRHLFGRNRNLGELPSRKPER
jgi:hypothetical protein